MSARKHIVVVAGPTKPGCDQITGLLEGQADIELRRLVFSNSIWDSSAFRAPLPELVILDLGDSAAQVLSNWAIHAGTQRAPIIMIGPLGDDTVMRRSMQAGARDYLTRPLQADQFVESVRHVLNSITASTELTRGQLTAVINAKGGSGASFLACNLAHILAADRQRKTALIDLDLQFGALPLMLDLKIRDNLFDVITAADNLDPVALQGYMAQHKSGLQVLSSMTEQLALPSEISIDAVRRILEVASQTFEHVVVDLPRQIDPLSEMVLKMSSRVLVVMQQSFAHVRDAKRMYALLIGYLGIPADKITLVINRYHEKNEITGNDIHKALNPVELVMIPNDFNHVTNSLNLGVPLYEGARHTPVTESLCILAARLDGESSKDEEASAPSSQLRKTISRLFNRTES